MNDETQIGLLLFILAASGFAAWQIWLRESMKNWYRVSARITSSRVESETKFNRYGSSLYYSAAISYEYEIGGETFKSSKTTPFSLSSNIHSLAESKVKRYPVGRVVQAYVSPVKSEKSFLEPPSMTAILLNLTVISILILAALNR